MFTVEQQISTGNRLAQGSDDPGATVGIQQLNFQVSSNEQFSSNLSYAGNFLSTVDSTLGSTTNLINQAKSIASQDVGTTSTPDQRTADANMIHSLIQQALSLANTRYQGAAIFWSANSTQDPFSEAGNGYKFQGSSVPQSILTNDGSTMNFSVDGNAVFGGLSGQVKGYQQSDPDDHRQHANRR